MPLSKDHIDTLHQYITYAVNDKQSELEIRFSTFVRPDLFAVNASEQAMPTKYRFEPLVDVHTFHRVLDQYKNYGLQMEKSSSVDTFYDYISSSSSQPPSGYLQRQTSSHSKLPSRQQLRHCLIKKESGDIVSQWMLKKKCKVTDIWQYNIRISLSSEIELKNAAAPHQVPNMVRRKERTSFVDKCVRYDFTAVTTEIKGRARTSYEIEMEILVRDDQGKTLPDWSGTRVVEKSSEKNRTLSTEHVFFCLNHLLQTIHESPAIITLRERHDVSNEYASLIAKLDSEGMLRPRFIGAQPETLHKKHLPLVRRKHKYSVTEKYDGERNLLYIAQSGRVYLINRRLRIRFSGLSTRFDKRSLLDVELVDGAMYAFDILFHRGKDLRADHRFLLRERLKLVSDIVDNLHRENRDNDCCIPIYLKYFEFADPGKFCRERAKFITAHGASTDFLSEENDEHMTYLPLDGFIFTPVDEPYPRKSKWTNLLKWKPPELNSIDFCMKRNDSDVDLWDLYVGKEEGVLIPFEPYPVLRVTSDIMEKVSCMDSRDVKEVGIVECVWDYSQSSFLPLRKRVDKATPNFFTVAMDVWESIQNPVTLQNLQKSPFEHMRQFHNRVKSSVIQTAVTMRAELVMQDDAETTTLWADMMDDEEQVIQDFTVLDLACGRGGDLWKWAASVTEHGKTLKYVGIDINDILLSEAQIRAEQVSKKYGNAVDCRFLQSDLRTDDDDMEKKLSRATSSDNRFAADIVSCQFALHYFFADEETYSRFFGLVKKYMKPGGIFITSQFDGQLLLQQLSAIREKKDLDFDIIPQFSGDCSINDSGFGIPVSVVLHGDDQVILKEATVEYLIFPDKFVERMKEIGFVLKESRLFSELRDQNFEQFSVSESVYSDLHRYYIFSFDKREDEKANDGTIQDATVATIREKFENLNLQDANRNDDAIGKVETETNKEEDETKNNEKICFDSWTIKSLREYAKKHNVRIPSVARRKSDIIKIIVQSSGQEMVSEV